MKSLALALALFALMGTTDGLAAATAAAPPPTIDSESMSNLTPTDATLEAEINPQSTERASWYQFQVATDLAEFPPEFTCPTEGFPSHTSLCVAIPSQPGALPISWLPPGTEDESVSLDLASAGMELQPGVTYYWRVIAAGFVQTVDTIAWEKPAVHGASMSFETPALTSAPTIDSESMSDLTPTDATLEANINPGGLETSYRFHLVERQRCEEASPPCDALIREIPLPEGQLPASTEGQHVSLDLNSAGVNLKPGHDFYEYWISAANSIGSSETAAQSFVAPGPPPEPEEQPGGEPAQSRPGGAGSAPAPPALPVAQANRCPKRPHKHRKKAQRRRRRAIGRACAAR